ncbi:tripartite motif-containing protein 44 isoform X4 [Manis javanica]|uniref:tripartite motif-containing protein 44 isoform X4 n=1 Tax=Manis javanica TaxID=9974 RepID=UPI003C6DB25A
MLSPRGKRRKKATATLNNSGSERRPPNRQRESGTGAIRTGNGAVSPPVAGDKRGAGADGGAGPRRRKCPRRQRKRRGHQAAERWKALSPLAGRGLPGAGGSGAGPQACSGIRRGPRGCRLPGTGPGSGGGLKGAARRQSGQLGVLRPWPLPSAHMASGVDEAVEELPHDGTCDECEPDEAPGADEVCRECGFCYCRGHAEAHRQKFPSHHLAGYVHGAAQPWTSGAQGNGEGPEDVEAKAEEERDIESELREDSESEEESESEDDSDEESEEDSEEEMEDEQESEADEDNQEGESEAEGETEAESEFDPEIEMEAERVAKRKCLDHGLDLSTYCQEDKQLICVLCPVTGAHQGHQLSTLDEAFEELRSKDSGGLKAAMIELVERLKFKSSDPKVTQDQMKEFIQQEFKKVQKVIADEEQKALHLVDIQEAMATAHVTEILADIQSHMDRLMTQMAQAKEQLDTSNESAEPKALEGFEEGPSGASEEEDT